MIVERTEYKSFVVDHILRPYQSDILDKDEPVCFSEEMYEHIPNFLNNNAWRIKTFNRISRLDMRLDAGIFPDGMTGTLILAELHHFGVQVIYSPGSRGLFPAPSPLRTVLDSFPSHGSSIQ